MTSIKQDGISLPIEWHTPEHIISRYATNMMVQYVEHEFVLSFYEVQPPLTSDLFREEKGELKKLMSVQANCVSRVIVAKDKMPQFIAALQKSLEKMSDNKNGS